MHKVQVVPMARGYGLWGLVGYRGYLHYKMT
jgi:hypothetical protein